MLSRLRFTPPLARLKDSGLATEGPVEQEAGPEKHIYVITSAGRTALAAWFESGIEQDHQRDGFFIKLMLSLATGDANPRQVIQAQRTGLFKDLHAITAQRQRADPKRS